MAQFVISTIIEQSDITKLNGLRDRFFMIFLYDTGARIDEMIRIELCDLDTSKISKITLHGKGGKVLTQNTSVKLSPPQRRPTVRSVRDSIPRGLKSRMMIQ